MDAGAFFAVGAWAPVPSRVVVTKDRPQQLRPSTTTTTTPTAVGKAVDNTLPQQIPNKAAPADHSRTACMRGPAREVPPTDPAKGAIDFRRPEPKVDSCSDETSGGGDFGSRSGCTSRTSAGRRGHGGSASSSSPPRGGGAVSELPTVAEVLRNAKTFLQPTHAVERQFYADCYRACQVMPTSTTTTTIAASGRPTGPAEGVGNGSGGNPAPPPPALPYLSSVPEVALRLSCLGYRVVLRRVTDSRQYWSRSMTNLFAYCVLPGTGIGYVLDPGFKEHFRAGRMSDRYRDIWECLPPLFVGPPAKLVQLVQSLCSELQASFESSHRQLPPWRTFSCTINRWMSPVFRDLPVPIRRPMPAAAAAGGGGTTGIIPAADAQAFLRASEELLAGTASARPGGYSGVAAAASAASSVAAASAASSVAAASPVAAGGGGGSGGAPVPAAAAAAQAQGASAGSGLSSGTEGGEGRGSGGGTEAGTSAATAGRSSSSSSAEEAAPCRGDGDAARPMAYNGGGAAAAAAAASAAAVGRVEVPGGPIEVSTAATAAASSSAWGPPPRSEARRRQPLRIVTGFELRQQPAAQVRVQAPGGGGAAEARTTAAAGDGDGDDSAGGGPGRLAVTEPIRSAGMAGMAPSLARRMAALEWASRAGEQLRYAGLQRAGRAAGPAGPTAAAEAEAAESLEGLISRSLRSLSLVPGPPRRQQQ